jgi:hypothetical protein
LTTLSKHAEPLSNFASNFHWGSLRDGLMREGRGKDSWNQRLQAGQTLKVPVTSENKHLVESGGAAARRSTTVGGGGGHAPVTYISPPTPEPMVRRCRLTV